MRASEKMAMSIYQDFYKTTKDKELSVECSILHVDLIMKDLFPVPHDPHTQFISNEHSTFFWEEVETFLKTYRKK